MNSKIIRRSLTPNEINHLIKDIQYFPDLTFVSKDRWENFKIIYVVEVDNTFAGVCVVHELQNTIKLGPLVLLRKFHGNKLGSKMLSKILQEYNQTTIYIGSSNAILQRILTKMEFQEIPRFGLLPQELKTHLLQSLFQYLSLQFITEAIRKKVQFGREKYRFYLKIPLGEAGNKDS